MSGLDENSDDPLELQLLALEERLVGLERRLRRIEISLLPSDEASPPASLAESIERLSPLMADLQEELSRAMRLSALGGDAPP